MPQRIGMVFHSNAPRNLPPVNLAPARHLPPVNLAAVNLPAVNLLPARHLAPARTLPSTKPLPLPTKTTPTLFRGNFQNTMTIIMRNPGGGCSSCGH